MKTTLEQLELGAKSAEQVQEELDFRIQLCYESMQRMCRPTGIKAADISQDGMFGIFKMCFAEDLKRLGLEI
jgi:hypothetical protein